MKRYIVQNIKLPVEAEKDVAFAGAKKRLLIFFSEKDILRLEVCKMSVDARRRGDIKFVWSVAADICSDKTPDLSRLAEKGIVLSKPARLDIKIGDEKMSARPVIVGFGPCGMFCALILARNGYRPIVVERGKGVFERAADVNAFFKTGILNENSNVQFGAGGAGTFSDGKLVTRINDEKCAVVIEEMYKHGAPSDILYKAKPHVGTDKLGNVVKSFEDEIISLGGEIRYNTVFNGINSSLGKITSVKTSDGDVSCGALILCVGHSARDTFKNIERDGVILTAKPFSVGVRIEHLQNDIDKMLYGDMAGDPRLPRGEYSLSHRCENGRGVYSFCMCPGGDVVAAASEHCGIVTNGMSNSQRNGKNANSAICVSVLTDDFGNTVDGAMKFQRDIERAAFRRAGDSFFAPAQTLGDFLSGECKSGFSRVEPTYMNGKVMRMGFDGIFPKFVTDSIKEGIYDFDRKFSGFASANAVLTAPETRTSSPVRINRNDRFIADGFDNLYPCGEGAGYAGGITSAGVDGISCALEVMARYKI